MSITYASHLVVGVLASDIFNIETTTIVQDRYSPITGEKVRPITVTTKKYFLFGREIQENDLEVDSWEFLPFLKEYKLETFKPAHIDDDDYNRVIIGIEVIGPHCKTENTVTCFDEPYRIRLIDNVKQKLESLGCKIQPEIFLVTYCG